MLQQTCGSHRFWPVPKHVNCCLWGSPFLLKIEPLGLGLLVKIPRLLTQFPESFVRIPICSLFHIMRWGGLIPVYQQDHVKSQRSIYILYVYIYTIIIYYLLYNIQYITYVVLYILNCKSYIIFVFYIYDIYIYYYIIYLFILFIIYNI